MDKFLIVFYILVFNNKKSCLIGFQFIRSKCIANCYASETLYEICKLGRVQILHWGSVILFEIVSFLRMRVYSVVNPAYVSWAYG